MKKLFNHHSSFGRLALTIFVVLFWFFLGSIGGPTFGKLSNVVSNNQESFLPKSADSTKVQNLLSKFKQTNSIPAVIVVESSHGFTKGEIKNFVDETKAISTMPGIAKTSDAVVGPILSKDGKAIEIVAQIANSTHYNNVIQNLQNSANRATPKGAKAYVTGPAGIGAALVNAFKGINGTLLYVALGTVFIILLFVYRSIVLPIVVLITGGFALSAAGFAVYHGVQAGWFKLNGQSQGILSILVIGAATDYSLLLTARYREALEHYPSKWDAMKKALTSSAEPIIAAGSTVILGLLCLTLSDLNSNKSLGPVAAFGILFSLLAGLTFLPAVLLLLGRSAYWPLKPKFSKEKIIRIEHGLEDRTGLWLTIPKFVERKSRVIWLTIVALLVIAAAFLPTFKASGVSQSGSILSKSSAITGQTVLSKHFPAGSGSPVFIVSGRAKAASVIAQLKSNHNLVNVAVLGSYIHKLNVTEPIVVNNQVLITATLKQQADSNGAENTVKSLRTSLSKIDNSVLIGGDTAIQIDTIKTSSADLHKIIPAVLIVILIILILLLRSLLAPLLLIASVILSYSATIGISAIIFNHVMNFPGADPAIPLFGFIFLVALGVDYNIFLMTRVREESKKHGTAAGVLRGLSLTGSVITSAGIVLAATFGALAVVPVLFLVQIAFIVSFGVLLDTIIVRSLLVPALSYDIGKKIWWPSKLSNL